MIKKLYETLDLETVRFGAEDVLATSGSNCPENFSDHVCNPEEEQGSDTCNGIAL